MIQIKNLQGQRKLSLRFRITKIRILKCYQFSCSASKLTNKWQNKRKRIFKAQYLFVMQRTKIKYKNLLTIISKLQYKLAMVKDKSQMQTQQTLSAAVNTSTSTN